MRKQKIGFFKTIFNFFKRFTLTQESESNRFLWTGSSTKSGSIVTEKTSLNTTTVLACVKLLSSSIASLPCILYKKENGKKTPAINHPLFKVLHDQANAEMTAYTFFETSGVHQELWGNQYAQILRNNGGDVIGLQPLRPEQTQVTRNEKKELVYITFDINNQRIALPAGDVLHIPGWGFDGLVGKSPIGLMREAVGLAVAAEETGARFFENGAITTGFLKHPGALSKEAQERLKESFKEKYGGQNNAHKIAVLEEGLDYTPISIPFKDTQFIETRGMQREEICTAFNVPPTLVGITEKQTSWGTGVEQLQIGFLTFTIRPKLVRLEQAMEKQLLTDQERRQGYEIKFNANAFLRGDMKTRFESYQLARLNGWLSVNEIREMEDLNPIDTGDIYLRPLNTVPDTEAFNPEKINNQEPIKKTEIKTGGQNDDEK